MSRYSRQLTYYGEPAAVPVQPSGHPERRDPLWGFTLEDIHVAARRAAATFIGVLARDFQEQYDAAWHGICELLLTSETRPAVHDLNRAGWTAVSRHTDGERSAQGRSAHGEDHSAGSMPAFAKYWNSPAHAPSPEDMIVNRLATEEILAVIPPREQAAIRALAACEDYEDPYQAAADAMGITKGGLTAMVTRGRNRFRALWHEGEEPSRPWRQDRRTSTRAPAKCGTTGGYKRHRRRREEICAECLQARREYVRAWEAARKEAARKEAA